MIRRLRLKADRGALSQAQIVNSRARINAATRFLARTATGGTTVPGYALTDGYVFHLTLLVVIQ